MSIQFLKQVSVELVKRYQDQGLKAINQLENWLSGQIPYAYPDILRRHVEAEQIELLFDAFRQILPFGTGGRRGRVGYGANRINPTTVAMTVQGHCQFLRDFFPSRQNLVVVVANDVRVFNDFAGIYHFIGENHPLLGTSSRSLGKLACEIYAGNGITAYFAEPLSTEGFISTPELSFLIGQLKAVGGINLSASHNPPDDNGIKIYDQFGSQPVAPDDQLLMNTMEKATQIISLPFEQAVDENKICPIPKELYEEYVEMYISLYDEIFSPKSNLTIVYTPLCGCGLKTAGYVLKRLNFPVKVPPKQDVDGGFSVIPFKSPNPEVLQATEPAKEFADKIGSGIVLSSDPDADRVGLEIKLPDGSWYHFDGNQIAAILGYFLMLDPNGPKKKGLVIETLVTTRMLRSMVKSASGCSIIDDLPVGFKYVAKVLKSLEKKGQYGEVYARPKDLILAAEESHGVILIPTIRDKDATPACMYLAALYQRLREENLSLLDYYIGILEELGGYADVGRSIVMGGVQGITMRDQVMNSLRESPPQTLGGQKVKKIVDFWDQEEFGAFLSESDRLPRNVIQFTMDGYIVTIRPSGTEPKLKFYCQIVPNGNFLTSQGFELLREVESKADEVARRVYQELLLRLNINIGTAGLLLPDIIDLDSKRHFENKVVEDLYVSFSKSKFSNLLEVFDWLRSRLSDMTPGSDPIPALKAPLAYLCEEWKVQLPSVPIVSELEKWTKE